jgi:hypothetical protein
MWVLLLPLAELLTLYMNFISLGVLLVSRLLVRESTAAALATAEPTTFTLLFYSQVGKRERATCTISIIFLRDVWGSFAVDLKNPVRL